MLEDLLFVGRGAFHSHFDRVMQGAKDGAKEIELRKPWGDRMKLEMSQAQTIRFLAKSIEGTAECKSNG